MKSIQFEVFGAPGPQGSKRHVGGGRMIESSKKVAPWREAVKWAALEAMRKAGIEKFTGPVRLLIVFTLARPKSASKRKALWPATRPDLSKLVRSTEDAITDAGVWADDGRVVSMIVDKTYPADPELSAAARSAVHCMALSRPGAVVRIIPAGWRMKWLDAVRALPFCVLCGRAGVQAAHRNEGKGMGAKVADHLTAALCPDCHHEIDNGRDMLRDERRARMDRAIVLTHDALVRAGRLVLE